MPKKLGCPIQNAIKILKAGKEELERCSTPLPSSHAPCGATFSPILFLFCFLIGYRNAIPEDQTYVQIPMYVLWDAKEY